MGASRAAWCKHGRATLSCVGLALAVVAVVQVAYDYDFTIAHYNVSLGHTIYELAKEHLVRPRTRKGRGAVALAARRGLDSR